MEQRYVPADKSAWTQTELGDVDPIEVHAPPGPEFALGVFIPAAIDHQYDWVLVEHALNARLYFEPPHRCLHQIVMIMSGSLTEPDLEAARSVLEGQIGGQGRGWKIVRVDERHLC